MRQREPKHACHPDAKNYLLERSCHSETNVVAGTPVAERGTS